MFRLKIFRVAHLNAHIFCSSTAFCDYYSASSGSPSRAQMCKIPAQSDEARRDIPCTVRGCHLLSCGFRLKEYLSNASIVQSVQSSYQRLSHCQQTFSIQAEMGAYVKCLSFLGNAGPQNMEC